MFFIVNWVHDRWAAAGFDEAAGNAQQVNFGRDGLAGDPVLAEANTIGVENAGMDTMPDGASPRMQMYVWPGPDPDPDRTGSIDAHMVIHELGHHLSQRLIGNAQGGLDNQQGMAMGEGWGDFLALMMTSQASDDFDGGVFAMGGWTLLGATTPGFVDNYYYGARRYPYSTRFDRNPLTLRHIAHGEPLPTGVPISPRRFWESNNDVHNAGEVWCSALWEVFVNLVAQHGHLEAERRMLRYVIAGMKQTPILPTFIQARDAILSVIGSVDRYDLLPAWRGFAKRGLGAGAEAPLFNSIRLKEVTESFTVPAGLVDETGVPLLCELAVLM
jgi:hypothetical protein